LQIPTLILTFAFMKTSFPWLGNVLSQIVQHAGAALIAPLWTISVALIYFDIRVRKEAFDIELMMRELDGTPGSQPYGANVSGPEQPPPGYSGGGLQF
jgi:hypothetical protein